ncbi:hypothetical protein KUCAC02_003657 [Chaenocephalus aceratus]|uniref:Uncharacterized protein n=1 Tax=Chaenocephalus aceratus TaxID=36190 RepID=A0ACB9WMX4_CHAAC|nr:hypothetical protein KUCAC02_003657 [Chaenocephalus aceratus]
MQSNQASSQSLAFNEACMDHAVFQCVQRERDVGGECSEDCLTKDLPLSMIQNKVSDEDTEEKRREEKQQRMSSQSGREVDDQLSDEDTDKNEAEDKQQRTSSQSGREVDD